MTMHNMVFTGFADIFQFEIIFWENNALVKVKTAMIIEGDASFDRIIPCIDPFTLNHTIIPFCLVAVTIIQSDCPKTMEVSFFKITSVLLSIILVWGGKCEFPFAVELIIQEKTVIDLTIFPY